jgi:hypothetical protein
MNIIKIIKEKIFFGDLLKEQRLKYYKSAYEQGRFDEDFEREYKLGKYEKDKE